VTICSTAFTTLGKAQAASLGNANLPIAVIPHPFGAKSREEVRGIADRCADEIARMAAAAGA
jgi:hypothetical protein